MRMQERVRGGRRWRGRERGSEMGGERERCPAPQGASEREGGREGVLKKGRVIVVVVQKTRERLKTHNTKNGRTEVGESLLRVR